MALHEKTALKPYALSYEEPGQALLETSPTLDGRQIHQILQAVGGVCVGVAQHLARLRRRKAYKEVGAQVV